MKIAISSLLTLLILSACSEQQNDIATKQERAQQQLSDDNDLETFSLTDLNDKTIKLSDYRGKWIVVNYWATWCPPCREEIPDLIKFQKTYGQQAQVLGVAYEDSSTEKLNNFVNDFSINYPILTVDIYNPPTFVEQAGNVLPTTVIYDKTGKKHQTKLGPIDFNTLQNIISKK